MHLWLRSGGSLFGLFLPSPFSLSAPLALSLEDVGGVEAAHPAELVDQLGDGEEVPLPGLPQVQDRLRRTGARGEVRHVTVHVEPFRQHPPVVALFRDVGQSANLLQTKQVLRVIYMY